MDVKPAKIKSIRKVVRETVVYDLTVQDNPNFFVEGHLVHNCPFNCIYCYANAFRASLYTAFFDNSKTMGFRHCNPKYYKTEMDKMQPLRALSKDEKRNLTGVRKAFALEIPIRLGIRFEDFLRNESRERVSLELLQYLSDHEYPVMINTKSDIVGRDEYVEALARNPGKTAVHITCITCNDEILKRLEPGAPSYRRRLKAMRTLSQAGVRVVARIEPYLFLLNDTPDELNQYMDEVWGAGVRNITFDTYSYTAHNPGIRQSFINAGYDFDRLYLAGCDSQPLGSLLLEKFMDLFREQGFSCSSFDIGNAPTNNQSICCEVGDWFQGEFNHGCSVMAARFIQRRKGQPVPWADFKRYVDRHGGFLTPQLGREVKELWNLGGNAAYSHGWAPRIVPAGRDEDGIIWRYDQEASDYRIELIRSLI